LSASEIQHLRTSLKQSFLENSAGLNFFQLDAYIQAVFTFSINVFSTHKKQAAEGESMFKKKFFHEAPAHSAMTDFKQRHSLNRSRILLLLLPTLLGLSNWGGGLPTAASAVSASAGSFDELPTRAAEVNDFDGDGITDYVVVRDEPVPESRERQLVWYILQSADQTPTYRWFGLKGDKLVSGDYDGDGKTDAAIFRKGEWWVQKSSDNTFIGQRFGDSTDLPVPADYDGDGKTDFAVYQPDTRIWAVLQSSDEEKTSYSFDCRDCATGDTAHFAPAPVDYDQDGKADPTLVQTKSATNPRKMLVKNSSQASNASPDIWDLYIPSEMLDPPFIGDGRDPDIPIRRDFNADGRTDLALVHNHDGNLNWLIFLNLANPQGPSLTPNHIIPWGLCNDYPVPGNYPAGSNGFIDLAVWRPEERVFYIRPTLDVNLNGGETSYGYWGLSTDTPPVLGGRSLCQ
jgi:hypothetical protein